jgi:hypothetical protein
MPAAADSLTRWTGLNAMDNRARTTVMNLLDDRTATYDLPPDRAVVAAFEEHEKGALELWKYSIPSDHPLFKEYRLGFACGDWVAYKIIKN